MERSDCEHEASSGRQMLFGLHTRKILDIIIFFPSNFLYIHLACTRSLCDFRLFLFQHVLKEDPKFDSTVINLLDVYNIGSFFKKSVFGSSVDNLMFFYRQKTHRYKYIFDEVRT